jgi:hypothetical protein
MDWDYWNSTVHHWNTTGYNWKTPGYHWSLYPSTGYHWEAQLITVGNIGIPQVLN